MTLLRRSGIVRTLVLGVAAFVVVAYLVYELVFWIHPPRTASGHKTMALGHAIIAGIAGMVASVVTVVLHRLAVAARRRREIAALARGDLP